MIPAEFLAVVLPSPGHGYYCAAELSTTRKAHAFEENIADLFPAIDKWHGAERDVYFALATYETKKAAALALNALLEKTGLAALGTPWIVGSGGGLHVDWPLDKEVDVASWKPVAENFKRLCKQESLAIDMTVTADAARVLRVPDTTNFKKKYETSRPVKLLGTGDIFTLEALGTVINSLLAPEQRA